ncbi:carboxylating nicotinate-nucleotide diphosphorylase [Rhodococcus aerolatus]
MLVAQGLDLDDVQRVVTTALEEDLRYGADVTTLATVGSEAVSTASVVPRDPGVLAGGGLVLAVLDAVLGAGGYEVHHRLEDGSALVPGEPALTVVGPTVGLLTAERTALNLVGHLSGVATATAAWARALEGTGCRVRDTRKTLPGLRLLQKYAVRCGGGVNHRMGLGDAALVKDNHVAAAGSVVDALRAVRATAPELPCEVEVDTLEQLDAVLAEGAELVLLDNFDLADAAEAVRRRDAVAPTTWLEGSGRLTLETAAAYGATGVEYVAVGGLTHSVRVLDLGLDLHERG